MKKIFLLFIFFASIFGCTKDNTELRNQLIGIWDDHPNGFQNQIQFYQDSIVLWSYCHKSVGTWKANSSKISMHFPDAKFNPDLKENLYWMYRLNKAKDSLFIKIEKDTMEHLLPRVKDFWSHYLKAYNLKIDIPTANPLTSLRKIESNKYPIIHIGWKSNLLEVKGVDYQSKGLKTKNDYAISLFRGYEETLFDTIHPITLVVDKNITKKSLDSIKDIIRSINFQNLYFFQVYDFKEGLKTNYGNISPDCINGFDWYWYGLYDWNGLDNQ
jgi:hypothetical protein